MTVIVISSYNNDDIDCNSPTWQHDRAMVTTKNTLAAKDLTASRCQVTIFNWWLSVGEQVDQLKVKCWKWEPKKHVLVHSWPTAEVRRKRNRRPRIHYFNLELEKVLFFLINMKQYLSSMLYLLFKLDNWVTDPNIYILVIKLDVIRIEILRQIYERPNATLFITQTSIA